MLRTKVSLPSQKARIPSPVQVERWQIPVPATPRTDQRLTILRDQSLTLRGYTSDPGEQQNPLHSVPGNGQGSTSIKHSRVLLLSYHCLAFLFQMARTWVAPRCIHEVNGTVNNEILQ